MTDVHFTGSVFYNYVICPRKAWLMQYQLDPDTDHDLLDQGRLTNQEHYKRADKELELPGIKVDQVRYEGDQLILGEVKKSSAGLDASIMQLAYYLSRLADESVDAKGEVLIPKERRKVAVVLDDDLKEKLDTITSEIRALLLTAKPPKASWLAFCPNCAYAEFCWSGGKNA